MSVATDATRYETERAAAARDVLALGNRHGEVFDRLADVVKHHFRSPFALITVVSDRTIRFLGKQGLPDIELDREGSFCDTSICNKLGITIIQDAATDPNFRDNPIVKGAPNIRFYAGVPVTFGNKLRIGNVCVLDTTPRSLDYGHQLFLKNIAEITQAEIERIARETFQKLTPVF
jgi:GAF domain-containing protein